MALLQISEPGLSGAPHQRNIAIGIDLGTTNSLVAAVKSGEAIVLTNAAQETLIPSVVYYAADGSHKVGQQALTERINDPAHTIISVKRFMGRSFSDLDPKLTYPYQFATHAGMIEIATHQGYKNPIQVSSDILRQLKQIAVANLGEEPIGAVITVPAYFDEGQRQATKHAAELAGLKVLRLLNEPTAAAIAYGLDSKNEGTFLVYDLGGGTLDVSILRLNKGIFEVLAVSGDTHLGGDDFDHLLYCYILDKAKLTQLTDKDTAALLNLAKSIKEQLSNKTQVAFNKVLSNKRLVNLTLSRDELFSISEQLLQRALVPVKKALRDAKLAPNEIDEVIMVGGSTRLLNIRQAMANFFNRELLAGIDPDKVVAIGAAIQADILAGNRKDDLLLLDVTPLSLGIETMGGMVEKIIPRNSTLPITRAQDFTTYKDGQTAMSIHVLQGEREMVQDCRSLAKFSLTGIPPMNAGAARIRITFQIDADGLLAVSAMEQTTGIMSSIEVKPSFGLNEDQIAEMLQTSITHAKEDVLTRQLSEAIIEANSLLETIQTALTQDSNLLTKLEQSEITAAMAKLVQLIKTEQEVVAKTRQIKELTHALNLTTEKFAAKRIDKAIKAGLAGKRIDSI
ncbi:MAG: Fe-S protein assembly chaperone HscA [Burkholderiales bacterium]